MMPQVVKNASNFMAGNARALAALSWVGYSSSYFGNLLLLAYFVTKQEREAALIQAIGVASNTAVLAQIWAAGYMPGTAFGAVILLSSAALVITGLKVTGKLEAGRKRGKIWTAWHQALGLIGVALLPQAIWATFSSTITPLPACIAGATGAAFLALDRSGQLPPAMRGHWASVPGWTATLLFMFQPLAQAVSNFSGTADLAGLSVGSLLLAMTGNGLMVPRALAMRDAVWLTGSTWGTLLTWTQLLSLFVSFTPSGGRYFPGWIFAVTSILLAGYLAVIAFKDAEARRPSMTTSSL
ncbi:hypothetical protein WJX84_006809 [Apatococcus fuscideae]|uniref:Uncharacterized protein n=1 Tax=Apatococcus fuscideae TaxID=2026836 RepID=A0AAW1TKR2_9CHLO